MNATDGHSKSRLQDVFGAVDIGTTWIKCQTATENETGPITRERRAAAYTSADLVSRQQEDNIENLIARPLEMLRSSVRALGVEPSTCRLHLIESGYWPGTLIEPEGHDPLALMMHDLRAAGQGPVPDWSYRIEPTIAWVQSVYGDIPVRITASNSAFVGLLSSSNVVDLLSASGWSGDYPPTAPTMFDLPEPVRSGDLIAGSTRDSALSDFGDLRCYGSLPDTAGTILEAGEVAEAGDFVVYLGSFGMCFELTVPPTAKGIRSVDSAGDLYGLVEARPQEGQWAEALGLVKPAEEEPLRPRLQRSASISIDAPHGAMAMQRLVSARSCDWREYSLNRLSVVEQLPRDARVIVLGGGASAFAAGQTEVDGRDLIVHQATQLGGLHFLRSVVSSGTLGT